MSGFKRGGVLMPRHVAVHYTRDGNLAVTRAANLTPAEREQTIAVVLPEHATSAEGRRRALLQATLRRA